MKLELLVVGKTDSAYLREGITEYEKRLGHYLPFGITVIPDIRNTRGLSEVQQKDREGKLITDTLQPSDYAVLLDERGKTFTSVRFADYVRQKMASGIKRLVFIIGGPYGFSEAVYNRADDKISLSSMTFSHQMVRLIAVEQLYRAMTILKGEPYHHE